VPERVAEDAPPRRRSRVPRFRRPDPELVRRMARRVVRGGRASFRSQTEFRDALLELLRREEPLATIGGPRLRRLLLDVPGVRMTVRYTERADGPPPTSCPVCGSALKPIRNQTLAGESIVLGQRCERCEYWTHRQRRVPVRYVFSKAGIDGRRFPEPA
jgi:hypothetical protein